VPYKGSSPAVADLLAGQVSIMFAPASTALPHIRSGKLKALATTGVARTEAAPELPTVQELGLKDFESSVWFGLNAPVGTPPAVIEKLRAAVLAAQNSADFQGQFKAQGIDIVKAGPKDYATLIGKETEKWARVIKAANVKPE
jgi:tripartite-type tricarboxylate transporter receptor subunit TctC